MAETKKEVVKETKAAPKKEAAKKTSSAPKKAAAPKAEAKKEAVKEVKETKAPAKKEAPKKEEAPKKVEAKKETKKVEAKEVKPVVTEAHAKVLGLKATPRKVRLVLDLVRGKSVEEAISILSLTHKDSAPAIIKLIKSAAANATNNFGMDEDKLYIAEIMASDSFKMRRFLPRAKGSASGMVKRFSNVYITVKERSAF